MSSLIANGKRNLTAAALRYSCMAAALLYVGRGTDDLERLTRFYTDVLGLPELGIAEHTYVGFEFPADKVDDLQVRWLRLPPNAMLRLSSRGHPASSRTAPQNIGVEHTTVEELALRRGHHMAFRVRDIEHAKVPKQTLVTLVTTRAYPPFPYPIPNSHSPNQTARRPHWRPTVFRSRPKRCQGTR